MHGAAASEYTTAADKPLGKILNIQKDRHPQASSGKWQAAALFPVGSNMGAFKAQTSLAMEQRG
jgi:hypothetical protein